MEDAERGRIDAAEQEAKGLFVEEPTIEVCLFGCGAMIVFRGDEYGGERYECGTRYQWRPKMGWLYRGAECNGTMIPPGTTMFLKGGTPCPTK